MKNRALSSFLTLTAIALSVSLLLGVSRMQQGVRDSFENTIAGTDLIVGARTGASQLLLSTVFHIGHASQNLSWESFQKWESHPDISWTIPLSFGDSHKGYRVVATTESFFQHFHYGRNKALEFQTGHLFHDLFEVVLGAEVAERLGYQLSDPLVLAHGVSSEHSLHEHEHTDKPFRVVGILKKTMTPVDRSLYISLEGLEAMHVDWHDGAPPLAGEEISAEHVHSMHLHPHAITAFLVGLKSKLGLLHIQRAINSYSEEALTAILPAATSRELWRILTVAESALLIIAFFVAIAGTLGMMAAIMTTLGERRREIAIIRSLGARPLDIFLLLLSEACLLGLGGCLAGIALAYVLLATTSPLLESYFGLFIPMSWLSAFDLALIASVFVLSAIAGCFPAFKAYKQSLADGLTMKL